MNNIKKSLVILGALLALSSCEQPQNNKIDKISSRESLTQQLGYSIHEDLTSLSEFTPANRDGFTKAITFKLNGKAVTVNTPIFTGIPVGINGYNENFKFQNGIVEISVEITNDSGEVETQYVYLDKEGKITDIRTYENQIPNYGGMSAPAIYDELNIPDGIIGRVIGNNVMVVNIETHKQVLCDLTGKHLSEEFDAISYFYDGIALVQKDNKVGFIDEQGKTLLEPTIEFDNVKFKPKNAGMNIPFTDEDAFILPIDGEYAIISLVREK